ncbi:MAG: PASTA domain-containing protein, partial [Chloroflexota bacterium]
STVQIVLDLGEETVAVPDLRAKTENEALTLIFGAKLTPGTRTEEFDDLIPLGSIISQEPGAGQIVTQGLAVNYVVSKGPEPTPTPSPSPTPSPTPAPTPPPTEPPTPAPTVQMLPVGDYSCMTLAEATAAITDDGFTVGPTAGPAATGRVVAQLPESGSTAPVGSAIRLTFEDAPAACGAPAAS